jgi:tetraacyldisaccharide 4'-kinase
MIDWRKVQQNLSATAVGRGALWLLSAAYGTGVWTRTTLFKLGVLPRRKLPIRTVCFGNLTAGGTGKTSAVLLAAEQLAEAKLRPAILSRGYGRPNRRRRVVVLAGDGQGPDWRSAGDEPWMLRESLRDKGVPVLVSPDRYLAGTLAAAHHRADVALLDDGFQHLQLERDSDVVLVNAADPFGGGLLPLGLAREPLSALKRASLIVLTHTDRVQPRRLEEIRKELLKLAPGIPHAEAVHKPRHIWDPKQAEKLPLARLKGKEVVTVCGLGDPDSFEGALRKLGAEVKQSWRYPDHHRYTAREIRSLQNLRGGRAIVTTFKDLPRLPKGWKTVLDGELWVLCVGMKILKGAEEWNKAVLGE